MESLTNKLLSGQFWEALGLGVGASAVFLASLSFALLVVWRILNWFLRSFLPPFLEKEVERAVERTLAHQLTTANSKSSQMEIRFLQLDTTLSQWETRVTQMEVQLTSASERVKGLRGDLDLVNKRMQDELFAYIDMELEDLTRKAKPENKKRILWAEDTEPWVAPIVQHMEGKANIVFDWVRNNKELCERLKRGERYDVYVTDIHREAPDTDGIVSIQMIRNVHPEATILVCAGQPTIADHRDILDLHRVAYREPTRALIIRQIRKLLYG